LFVAGAGFLRADFEISRRHQRKAFLRQSPRTKTALKEGPTSQKK
jgi:hypothetical protein